MCEFKRGVMCSCECQIYIMFDFRAKRHEERCSRSIGHNRERGGGVGPTFSRLYSTFRPLVKIASKASAKDIASSEAIKKEAIKAGIDVVSAALKGQDVGEAVQERLNKVERNLKQQVAKKVKKQKGSKRPCESAAGPVPARKKPKKPSEPIDPVPASRKLKKAKTKMRQDIFDMPYV